MGTITFDTQKPLIYQTNITGSDNHFRYLMKLYQIACTFHKDAHLMFIENCTPQEKDFLKKFSIIECGGEKKLLGMPTMRAFECNESKAVIESSIENNVIHKEITDEKEVSSTLKNFDLNNLQYNENKQVIKPDDKLKTLLGLTDEDELTYFTLQKYMNKHFVKVEKAPLLQ